AGAPERCLLHSPHMSPLETGLLTESAVSAYGRLSAPADALQVQACNAKTRPITGGKATERPVLIAMGGHEHARPNPVISQDRQAAVPREGSDSRPDAGTGELPWCRPRSPRSSSRLDRGRHGPWRRRPRPRLDNR